MSHVRTNDPDVIERALREVDVAVQRAIGQRAAGLTCPLGFSCQPDSCPNAFRCGALPHKGTSWRNHLFYVVLAIVGMFLFEGLILACDLLEKKKINLPQNRLWMFVAIPFATGLVVYFWRLYSSSSTRRQVRDKATLARVMKFGYFDDVFIEEETARKAFPILHAGDFNGAAVLLSGENEGMQIRVIDFNFLMSPLFDHNLNKVLRTLFGVFREMNKTLSHHTVVVFPDALTNVPDFFLASYSSLAYLIQREMDWPQVTCMAPTGNESLTNKKYYLCSQNPEFMDKIFRNGLEKYFAEHDGWNVQLIGGRMFAWNGCYLPFYQFGPPPGKDAIEKNITDAVEIRKMLIASADCETG